MNWRTVLAISLIGGTVCAAAQALPASTQGPSSKSSPAEVSRIDPQKEGDARRLMEITGSGNLAVQMMQSMDSNLRSSLQSSLPSGEYRAKLIDLFLATFHSKANGEAFVELIVPIYARHFTDDEIKQLITFYQTPIGKKAVSELPQVFAESQQAGREWGEELGQESMNAVLQTHPELRKALEEAQGQNSAPWIR